MLEYAFTRDRHLTQAAAAMGESFGHAWAPAPPIAHRAYALSIGWLANYIRNHPDWVARLKGVAKKPIVDWVAADIEKHFAMEPWERIALRVFLGLLFDIAWDAFIAWETGGAALPAEMLRGSVKDTLVRWTFEQFGNAAG